MALLEVNNLSASFESDGTSVSVLDRISFSVESGKTLGVVGESGCGKSVTALSVMRLLPKPSGVINSGEIIYDGTNLLDLTAEQMHAIRGNRIAMIFQDPMTALNPVKTVGAQLAEVYQLHFPEMKNNEQLQRAASMLAKVGIPAPVDRLQNYPHQLSGGMRQRVMIAMALACEPDILIADEPTTALDVTIQMQILDLMQQLQRDNGMAIMFITHDLGVIAELSDEVMVMYAGRIAEQSPVVPLFQAPKHPYTRGLMDSIPKLSNTPKSPLSTISGSVPSLTEMGSGCRFSNRCTFAVELCNTNSPQLEPADGDRRVACLRWRDIQ